MEYFQTKNPNLGKFWRVLQWKMEGLAIEDFGIIYDHSLYFATIWYIFLPFWYAVPRKIWQPWVGRFSDLANNQTIASSSEDDQARCR
jgi:hypothetical protein